MRVEVWLSKRRERPPCFVFFLFEYKGKEFSGTVGAEKVFYEGKEVLESRVFDKIYKVEIVEEEGFEGESVYVYLWEEENDMREEISLPSEPLWRKVKAMVVR